jgi:DNA-binding transcriptional LysR family regulator
VTNIDLKLLEIVNELHRTRSVSQAAESLGLSQSTISMSLAKLRKHFNDPLFVRTSGGMEPTPKAVELLELLKKAEELLQKALEHKVVFDPAISDRMFHICSTDIAKITMLPKLMRRLRDIAPLVRIELRSMTANTSKLLESGELDLAVGFIPAMGAGFCQQRLFKERFVCAVRAGHPRIANQMTLDLFESEPHLAIATSGTGHRIVERTLESKRVVRKVELRVPGFLGISPVLLATDCIVIVPEQLGQALARSGKIKLLPVPFNVPSYYVMQHWHERFTHDPANKWIRGVFADLFLAGP